MRAQNCVQNKNSHVIRFDKTNENHLKHTEKMCFSARGSFFFLSDDAIDMCEFVIFRIVGHFFGILVQKLKVIACRSFDAPVKQKYTPQNIRIYKAFNFQVKEDDRE